MILCIFRLLRSTRKNTGRVLQSDWFCYLSRCKTANHSAAETPNVESPLEENFAQKWSHCQNVHESLWQPLHGQQILVATGVNFGFMTYSITRELRIVNLLL